MVLAYNRDHIEECREIMGRVPPELLGRLRGLAAPAP